MDFPFCGFLSLSYMEFLVCLAWGVDMGPEPTQTQAYFRPTVIISRPPSLTWVLFDPTRRDFFDLKRKKLKNWDF